MNLAFPPYNAVDAADIATAVSDEATARDVAIAAYIADSPVYADEAAAVTGGLATGKPYQTSTGELRIKL